MTALQLATNELVATIEEVREKAEKRKILKPEQSQRLDSIKSEYTFRKKRT